MSTKSIRNLIEDYRKKLGGSERGADALAALDEVKAIEQAAKEMNECGALMDLGLYEDTASAASLLEAIAKEAS